MSELQPHHSKYRQPSALFFAWLFMALALVVVNPAAQAQETTVVQIASGTLDRDRDLGPRNNRVAFTPLTTGTHTIRVAWATDANIRFTLFNADNGDRIATTPSGANPAEWTGELDGSTEYEINIFAVSGSANYTATLETDEIIEDEPVGPITAVEITSATLDRDRNLGPRNTRVEFNALTTGTHTIRVDWATDANIRFTLFNADNGDRIATTPSGTNPAEWIGELDGSTTYELNIFVVSGSADITATLEVEGEVEIPLATITSQPTDITVTEQEFVDFSVTAEGSGTLSYQWFANGSAIAGATSDTLTVRATLSIDNTVYTVEITDNNGTVTSDSATLSVVAIPLVITAQPENLTVTEGDNATFAVTATGSGTLSYQWFANASVIPDATNNTLTVNSVSAAADGTAYSVQITDGNNASATSNNAILSVVPPLPSSVINLGEATLDSERAAGPRFVSFSFDSLGDAVHTVTVAWDSDADVRFNLLDPNGNRVNDSAVRGTNPGVWSGPLDANTRYRLSIFSVDGIANISATVEASIGATIVGQPSDLIVTEGDDAFFSVEAEGSGNLTYQWLANGVPITGETGETLTVLATTLDEDGTEYSVEVDNGISTTTSDAATLTVNAPLILGLFSQEADTSAWILEGPAPTLDFNETEPNNGWGRVLLRVNDVLLVGGDFVGIRANRNSPTTPRPFLAALDAVSGQPVSTFQVPAQINSVVRALALSPSGDKVFIGGDFGFLAVDAITGQVDFEIDVIEAGETGRVFDIAVTQTQIYIGGDFALVNGEGRANIARLSLNGEVDDSWSPRATNGFSSGRAAPVQSVAVSPDGEVVYIGGNFDFVNDTAVDLTPNGGTISMLTVNASDGVLRPERFQPFVGNNIRSLVVHDMEVTENYVIIAWGGPNFLSFHSTDGARLQNYRGTGDIQSLQVVGDHVYVGHHGEFFGFLPNPIPQEAVISLEPEIIKQFELHSFRIDDPSFPPEQAWPLIGRFGVWGIAAAEDSIWVAGQLSRAGTNDIAVDGLVRFPALD